MSDSTHSTPPPPSPSASTSTPSPAPTSADAAKARREARKARILSKGSDRLVKLTKQARGDEAEVLYPSQPAPAPAKPGSPVPQSDAATSPAQDEDDPEEMDISHQTRMDADMERSMEVVRQQRQAQQQAQGGRGDGGDAAPQDPMQAIMAALTRGGGGSTGEGGGGGGAPGGMPDLSQLLAAMNGRGLGGGQQGGQPGAPPPPPISGLWGPQSKVEPSPRTLFDRLFSLAHIALFLLLGYFAISSTLSASPALDVAARASSDEGGRRVPSERLIQVGEAVHERHRAFKWASLAYSKPTIEDADYFRVDGSWIGMSGSVPIFWLFLTLEVLLQSSRILLFARQPPPSSLVFSLASQLPVPSLQWTLGILARYATIASSFLDDLAVLVFAVGCGILWCASSVARDAGAGSGQGIHQAEYAALGAKA